MSNITERNRTGNFLDDSEKSLTFRLNKQSQYYTSVSTDPLAENRNATNQALTGVYPAVLPMQFSTVGHDEKRVSFTLLISPETWNEGKNNTYQSTYTRRGWVPQLWGPNYDTVSSTGKTAAFMTPAFGLDNFTREMSFGYLNFLSMFAAYRSNGYKFEDFTSTNELTRVIKTVPGVEISYDNNLIMGHFNNFTLDEDEEHPYIFNYNFEFITSVMSRDEFEIRGHYKRLPVSEQDLISGTAASSENLLFVSDPYAKQPVYPTIPPKTTDDKTTIRLWEKITGLFWSEAFNLHQTDGSVQGNLILRQKLLSLTWNKSKRDFK